MSFRDRVREHKQRVVDEADRQAASQAREQQEEALIRDRYAEEVAALVTRCSELASEVNAVPGDGAQMKAELGQRAEVQLSYRWYTMVVREHQPLSPGRKGRVAMVIISRRTDDIPTRYVPFDKFEAELVVREGETLCWRSKQRTLPTAELAEDLVETLLRIGDSSQ